MAFYVTLPSNTITTRENFTGEFRVDLPHALEFEGDWEVGLASIQYPYSWNNCEGQSFRVYFDKTFVEVFIPNSHYSDIKELVTSMSASYFHAIKMKAKEMAAKEGIPTQTFKDKYARSVSFDYNTVIKRVTISVAAGTLHLNEELQYMLGFSLEIAKFTEILHMAMYPPDFTGGLTSLFIYTDIIVPQLVGNVEAPLLRIVPIKGIYGNIVVKDYDSLHYVNLRSKRFSSISVAIKDDRDRPIKFQFGKSILKLHFRKKRYF